MIDLHAPRSDRGVVTTNEIAAALATGSPVAAGVSGGKDSCALALALEEYLDGIGHTGPRILIHSDLGRVEWKDSLPTCERLALATGMELVVVRRNAGDMMDRWLVRWHNNVQRYADLSCVKLILPWSTPSMRFCTSELKTAVICRELVRRFPGQTIVSANGIRRAESSKRAIKPIAIPQSKLTTRRTTGYDWHPIIEWSTPDVIAYLKRRDFDLHEAYTRYGMSRVSCAFCIMSNEADLVAAASCTDNHDIYREMVDLEIRSTFGFQGSRWLADVAPALLSSETLDLVADAKAAAEAREAAEARIPDHLLYTKGWPTVMPTHAEAVMLAEVRGVVSSAVGIQIGCRTPDEILARYEALMRAKEAR